MKITDDNLDELFRSQLDDESKFLKAEEQWIQVSNRLKTDGRRKPVFWLLGLGLVMGITFILFSDQTPIVGTKSSEVTVTQLLKSDENLVVNKENPESPKENDAKKSKELELTSRTPITSIAKTPINPIINENPSDRIIEPCNCPADSLLGSLPNTVITYPETKALHYPVSKETTTAENISKEEKQNFTSIPSLRLLPTLQKRLQKPSPSLDLIPFSFVNSSAITPALKRRKLTLAMGILKDYYGNEYTTSSTVFPYLALKYHLSQKLQLSLSYNKMQVARGFSAGFEDYTIDPIYFVPDDFTVDTGSAQYSEQTLDLALGYSVYGSAWLDVSVLAGMLIEKRTAGTLDLALSSVYATVMEQFSLAEESFQVSKTYLGLCFEVPILNQVGLEFHLKRMIPVSSQAVNWGSYYRLSTGLNFKF